MVRGSNPRVSINFWFCAVYVLSIIDDFYSMDLKDLETLDVT